jgi:hypothetical protein
MKHTKLTTVLLNVALILVVAILFKSLLSFPKPLSAGVSVQAMPAGVPGKYVTVLVTGSDPEMALNKAARNDLQFVGIFPNGTSSAYLIFTRR